ncbi:hypothetical protein [Mesorhizobium cantuariense]|uniref:AP2/ERF domain-containing protein n=1 Tax=Mesorhizobium cantuariense TaxID=1300275 RepID=A0ABV7MR69_9HYPH
MSRNIRRRPFTANDTVEVLEGTGNDGPPQRKSPAPRRPRAACRTLPKAKRRRTGIWRRGASAARQAGPRGDPDQGEADDPKTQGGKYRLYSRKKDEKTGKRRNLGTFDNREAAEKHEREVQYFKRH